MAQFGVNEADNYGSNGSAGFFGLKNDKDTALVRFMYNGVEDIVGYAVHEVEIDGKKRYINCLRNYNEPIDNCPLCAARYKVLAKVFVPLYDEDSGEVRVWDRGKSFLSKLSGLCARFNPLVSTAFEIERNGKKGDTKTTYETYPQPADDTTLEDLPELPQILGAVVLDKTAEEMEYYLDNGVFPNDSNDTESEPDVAVPRRAARQPQARQEAPVRRTPMSRNVSANRVGVDKF